MLGANFASTFASKWENEQKQKVLAGIANDEVRKKWEHVTSKGYSEAELEDSRRKVRLVMEKMEKRLAATGAWLAGTYSLADIKNYSFTQHVERSVPDALTETKTPRSYEWLRKMDERPAVKACKAMARPR
jgi:glutathione S-transferase